MDVDMLANDEGPDAWGSRYRYPVTSAFEGPLPNGQLWWFPGTDLIELALTRISWSFKGSWSRTHVCLLPVQP